VWHSDGRSNLLIKGVTYWKKLFIEFDTGQDKKVAQFLNGATTLSLTTLGIMTLTTWAQHYRDIMLSITHVDC
jgi:hypothetical protein